MTDSNTVQCIPIAIISDSTTETDEECFTYTISTTSTAAGLTLNPTTATICISDEEGKLSNNNYYDLSFKDNIWIIVIIPHIHNDKS